MLTTATVVCGVSWLVQVGDCDLDEVFKGCAEEGKKVRSYRTRQSTGNWVKDQLSTVEKVRYRRAMGWR